LISFDKTGYKLYFYVNHLQQATLINEMDMCKEKHILFLKICMSLKVFRLTGWWKNLQH